jgi:N4-gp56 family major capsid protein
MSVQNLSKTYNPGPEVSGYYDRALMPTRYRKFVWRGFGIEKSVPVNEGRDITVARYGRLSDATDELLDGVTPEPMTIDRTPLTLRLVPHGAFIRYTDQVQDVGVDKNVLQVFSQTLQKQALSTLDVLCRDAIVAGTQVVYAGSPADGDTDGNFREHIVSKITKAAFQGAESLLDLAWVELITEKIDLANKYGAMPVDAAYVAIGHTNLLKDLEGLNLVTTGDTEVFVPVRKYASQGNLLEGEVGKVGRIRICLNSSGKIIPGGSAAVASTGLRSTGGMIDTYILQVFGKGYYANTGLAKGGIKSKVKPIGSGGSEDALDQRGSLGWKTWAVHGIVDDECGVRIECGASTL